MIPYSYVLVQHSSGLDHRKYVSFKDILSGVSVGVGKEALLDQKRAEFS
jgi:hypothetical protein